MRWAGKLVYFALLGFTASIFLLVWHVIGQFGQSEKVQEATSAAATAVPSTSADVQRLAAGAQQPAAPAMSSRISPSSSRAPNAGPTKSQQKVSPAISPLLAPKM